MISGAMADATTDQNLQRIRLRDAVSRFALLNAGEETVQLSREQITRYRR